MYKDERKLQSEGNKRQYRDQELVSSLLPRALSFVSWLVQSVLVTVQHKLSYPATSLPLGFDPMWNLGKSNHLSPKL